MSFVPQDRLKSSSRGTSARYVSAMAVIVLFFVLGGCSKPSQSTPESDAKGQVLNKEAMDRMIKEQTGNPPGTPGTGK